MIENKLLADGKDPALGAGGLEFKSPRPDHSLLATCRAIGNWPQSLSTVAPLFARELYPYPTLRGTDTEQTILHMECIKQQSSQEQIRDEDGQ